MSQMSQDFNGGKKVNDIELSKFEDMPRNTWQTINNGSGDRTTIDSSHRVSPLDISRQKIKEILDKNSNFPSYMFELWDGLDFFSFKTYKL